jgi:hypothetical protein
MRGRTPPLKPRPGPPALARRRPTEIRGFEIFRSAAELHSRALAAASAALGQAEIAGGSFSATIAKIPTVNRFAFRMSATVNAMPERSSPARSAHCGHRRSVSAVT